MQLSMAAGASNTGAAERRSYVFMVEPLAFYCNAVTAKDNYFQPQGDALSSQDKHIDSDRAVAEHRALASQLQCCGVSVCRMRFGATGEAVVPSPALPSLVRSQSEGLGYDPVSREALPDSIFPNNSFSIHATAHGKGLGAPSPGARPKPAVVIVLYPMSPGRRNEIPRSFLLSMAELQKIGTARVLDFRIAENMDGLSAGGFLEGTGAINFSSDETCAFVARSLRADEATTRAILGELWPCMERQHPPVGHSSSLYFFNAVDAAGRAVYHTNVVGWIGASMSAWCRESMTFDSPTERDRFDAYFHAHGITVLTLTMAEMTAFAGNALELRTGSGAMLLALSLTAWTNLTDAHRVTITQHYGAVRHCGPSAAVRRGGSGADEGSGVLVADVGTIERLGGGSVRCLLARCDVPVASESDVLLDSLRNQLHAR